MNNLIIKTASASMNFNSFILAKQSFIARNVTDLNLNADRSVSLDVVMRNHSILKDDSFFRTDDPDADPVQIDNVLRVIPFGRFHWILLVIYTILFISTSTLALNFAFFLMPQAYLCPVSNYPFGNQIAAEVQGNSEV